MGTVHICNVHTHTCTQVFSYFKKFQLLFFRIIYFLEVTAHMCASPHTHTNYLPVRFPPVFPPVFIYLENVLLYYDTFMWYMYMYALPLTTSAGGVAGGLVYYYLHH